MTTNDGKGRFGEAMDNYEWIYLTKHKVKKEYEKS